MVTSWPSLASSPAAVRPPGPEPTTATFLPVGGATCQGLLVAVAARPVGDVAFQVADGHGQALVAADALDLALGFLRADPAGDGGQGVVARAGCGRPRRGCPRTSSSMNCGMLTITGQPATHLGSLHCRQRSASSRASFSGRPRLTSLKLALRTSGSCSGIFCRSICSRCLVVILGVTGREIGLNAERVAGRFGTRPILQAPSAQAAGLLLELAIGAEAVHEQVEIDLVAVELRAVHAGELRLAADVDPAAAAHAGAVHHHRVERDDGVHAERLGQVDHRAHHRHRADRIDDVDAARGQRVPGGVGHEAFAAVAAVVGADHHLAQPRAVPPRK